MNRMLILLLLVLAVGCQNPAWQNPYAAFGPTTVPSPTMQSAPAPGYYQPPPATPATGPATATIRGPISAAPAATGSGSGASFAASEAATTEAPIRIVEASPKTRPSTTSSPPAFSTATREESPSAPIAAAPAVKFNAAPAPIPTSSQPALNRTRGYIPAAPINSPSPVPKNRLGAVPAIRRDSAVTPATYETATDASGAWKAR